jgi:hypothetical protein
VVSKDRRTEAEGKMKETGEKKVSMNRKED